MRDGVTLGWVSVDDTRRGLTLSQPTSGQCTSQGNQVDRVAAGGQHTRPPHGDHKAFCLRQEAPEPHPGLAWLVDRPVMLPAWRGAGTAQPQRLSSGQRR